MKKKKLPSLASLRRKLDKVFSAWIRDRDAPSNGYGPCMSCDAWAKLQAGHWIKRQHLAVRYDVRNVNGQCVRCNHFMHGNDGPYTLAMLNCYGRETVDELLALKHTTVKMTRADYEALIAKYS